MKTCTIIAGVHGAGKSSFAGSLTAQRHDLGQVVDIERSVAGQLNVSDTEARTAILAKIDSYMMTGIDFTLISTLHLQEVRIAEKAKAAGYMLQMYYIGLSSIDDAINRIHNRVKRGGYSVSRSSVEQGFERQTEAFRKILPYCDKVKLLDNFNGFERVGKYQSGVFSSTERKNPKWFARLQF